MTQEKKIIGRYAPSPTGELHLGNLRTAMLAWLQARLSGGKFLLRMEDLDQPRVVPGSADQILRDLEWLGLDWDSDVLYQSERTDAYRDALRSLEAQGLVYPCFCSRKDILAATRAPHKKTSVYPGFCRNLTHEEQLKKSVYKPPAVRLKVSGALSSDVGDFVIRRADTLFAYQLAVVVDDLHQEVNQVVRGADLLDSCSRQQYLFKKLAPHAPHINYLHAPLMLDQKGRRLAKRDGSASSSWWRAQNKTAGQLVAFLFNSLGLEPQIEYVRESISLAELLRQLEDNSFDDLWINQNHL